jgi:phage/plasmid primase-like uncharacterized protein
MSFTYKEQLSIVRDIHLSEGDRKTLDCPFCGGRRKFSITKDDGRVLWNCFRASCTAQGSYQGTRSIDAVKKRLTAAPTKPVERELTPLPTITTAVQNHEPALKYVMENNCLTALQSGLVKIRYSPGHKRVLFYSNDGKGAVGRSLVGSRYKWWTFGDVSSGIHVGIGDTAVLVEDVASACAVSNVPGMVGVALLGTTLTDTIRKTLATYNKIYIVLDNDASSKAVSLARKVGADAKVRLTKKDLKWLKPHEIEAVLMETELGHS